MSTPINHPRTIGILTGGGDVPGLNPAIRAITIRAIREGFRVIGIKNGWKGIINIDPSKPLDEQEYCMLLDEVTVNRAGRTGGTFLHTSRTRADKVHISEVPDHLVSQYTDEYNDLTAEVIQNLKHMGIDFLIPIGGDDTLSYAVNLHKKGIKLVAIPKTMDGDVPGTEYCIGFSTCVTRTIELTQSLRTSAGSHERFLVVEVFGKNAGFSALLPTVGGAADRCVVPEFTFDIEHLTELMVKDRRSNPSKYSVVLVSEGATFDGGDERADAWRQNKYVGVGEIVGQQLKTLSKKYNNGREISTITQKLGYLVRSGHPDALDTIVPTAYANMALDLIRKGIYGRMVCIRDGQYSHISIDALLNENVKRVNIEKFYDTKRYRPKYDYIIGEPMMILTRD